MDATRRARLQSVILQELSQVVRELKDPRVPNVTFTHADVAQDGSSCVVQLTILGLDTESEDGKRQMESCIAGLTSASGYMRRHLAKALTVRHIPELRFKEDRGLSNVSRVHELLKQINPSTHSNDDNDSKE